MRIDELQVYAAMGLYEEKGAALEKKLILHCLHRLPLASLELDTLPKSQLPGLPLGSRVVQSAERTSVHTLSVA